MKRTATKVVALAAILGAVACKKESKPSGTATAAGTGTGTATAAPGGSVAPTPPPLDAAIAIDAAGPTIPTDVPPFARTAGVDATAMRDLLDRAQSALDNGDDYALELAMNAVKADPGSGAARALLAEVVGDEAFSLAQLSPLTTATDCADCADALRNLTKGEWPASVTALAAKVPPSQIRLAAEAVTTFLGDGDAAKVAPYMKGKVVFHSICSVCDGDDGDETKKLAGPALVTRLAKQIAQAQSEGMGGFVAGGPMFCTKDCCEEPIGSLAHSHIFFQQVCFVPGTTTVRSLTVVDGG